MTKRFASLTSVFLLALGLAAFTGSALAGNGNGNGNGNDKGAAAATPTASATQPASQDSVSGNSENAPGQVKKNATATTQAQGSASQNVGAQAGVKPTNATAKGTTCGPVGGSSSSATCAPSGTAATNAQSAGKADASKRYGNDKTAAEVAAQNGATGVTLHGPGNSQPHKAALCPGGHEVDVHALNAKRKGQCAVTGSSPTKTSSSNVTVTTSIAASVAAVVAASTAPGKSARAPGHSQQGGVLGATASAGKSGPAGGVLGAVASGTLPFTGFPVWYAVLAALVLIVLGLALLRRGRATV